MSRSAMFQHGRQASLVLLMGALSACTAWKPAYENVLPVSGPAPYVNHTPMRAALSCLRPETSANPELRIGVADFVDGSGATMGGGDVNSRYFSQRPDLMLVVALSEAGVRLVNRTSTGVAEWEMRQAMDKRLGDGAPVMVGKTKFPYRPIRAGEFLGSSYYVYGAITEMNWAISSDVQEAGFLGLTAGRRTYRVSIAVDMVVTKSSTTEIVFARSYSKQLVGYETGAGAFRFVDMAALPGSRVELFQANIGQKKNEPVQHALRWLIETAAYDMVTHLYGHTKACDTLVPGALAGGSVEASAAAKPKPADTAAKTPALRTAPNASLAPDASPAPNAGAQKAGAVPPEAPGVAAEHPTAAAVPGSAAPVSVVPAEPRAVAVPKQAAAAGPVLSLDVSHPLPTPAAVSLDPAGPAHWNDTPAAVNERSAAPQPVQSGGLFSILSRALVGLFGVFTAEAAQPAPAEVAPTVNSAVTTRVAAAKGRSADVW